MDTAGAGLAQGGRPTGNNPQECDSDRLLFEAIAGSRRLSACGEDSRSRRPARGCVLVDAPTRNFKSRPERPGFTVRAGLVCLIGAWRGQGPREHSDRTRLYSETAREAQSLEAARAVLLLNCNQLKVDLGLPGLGYWWRERQLHHYGRRGALAGAGAPL